MNTQPQAIAFTFSGRSWEYFKIWIVNLFLTIITLSLYYPWAKVRKHRYFYGNTYLNNTPFAYLARPITLLKGWLIALALMATYVVLSSIEPAAGIGFLLLLFIATPWLVVRAIAFRARNSAYRNIRFNFRPAYGEAVMVFILLPIFAVITLGLGAPYVIYRQWRFIVNNSAYGSSDFTSNARPGQFYVVFGKAIGALFVLGILIAVLGFSIYKLYSEYWMLVMLSGAVAALVAYYLALFIVGVYIYARVQNLVWGNTQLESHHLSSTIRARDVLWIWFSSAVAIALSAGLLIPWAQIRFARYRIENLAIAGDGNFDHFVASKQGDVRATGEEIGEVFGINFGL